MRRTAEFQPFLPKCLSIKFLFRRHSDCSQDTLDHAMHLKCPKLFVELFVIIDTPPFKVVCLLSLKGDIHAIIIESFFCKNGL